MICRFLKRIVLNVYNTDTLQLNIMYNLVVLFTYILYIVMRPIRSDKRMFLHGSLQIIRDRF